MIVKSCPKFTTLDKRNVLFIIKCKRSMIYKLGLYLENITQHKGEFEVVFPSNSIFVIEKIIQDENNKKKNQIEINLLYKSL